MYRNVDIKNIWGKLSDVSLIQNIWQDGIGFTVNKQ